MQRSLINLLTYQHDSTSICLLSCLITFHIPPPPPPLPFSVMLEEPNIPTPLLKNAGLSHVHLVQSTLINAAGAMPEPSADLFGSKVRAR